MLSTPFSDPMLQALSGDPCLVMAVKLDATVWPVPCSHRRRNDYYKR